MLKRNWKKVSVFSFWFLEEKRKTEKDKNEKRP
jgi:hypothetical protein